MSKEIDVRALREKLTAEDIIRILAQYDIRPAADTENAIIFPTCCHNLTGGSNKLYYYKNTHLFKCYTHCEGIFDIFELLIKMNKLRGREISLFGAVRLCGLSTYAFTETTIKSSAQDGMNYLYNLKHTKNEIVQLAALSDNVMDRFIFDIGALSIWELEGISFDSMKRFGIKYDPIANCITIPNYDIDGNLISVRGRFLGEDAEAKYKPIVYGGRVLSHPSSLALYGLNITKNSIQKNKKVIIFEGEFSPLSIFPFTSGVH